MSAIEELIVRCEKIHSYVGWYCMSCGCEVEATFVEACATCGTPLDSGTITGNIVEAARDEFQAMKHQETAVKESE